MTGAYDLLLDDTDVGWGVAGRDTRVFGGSTLSHVLQAADRAIDGARPVNALHAVFVGPGDARMPVRYVVTPLKRGRTIDVLAVEARQADRLILTAHVTFHGGTASPDFQDRAPAVPTPARLSPVRDAPGFGNALVRAPFEVRPVPRDDLQPRQDTWIRLRASPEIRPNLHAAHLAYAMDFLITRPAHVPLDPGTTSLFGASLDHAMWFHRPFDIGSWLLVSSRTSTFSGSRSLSHSQVFDRAGALVASGTQEALLPSIRAAEGPDGLS